jgi:two-component sensor histidine kinase
LVHEKLYQSADLARIDMEEYIQSLVKVIKHLFALDNQKIAIEIDVDKSIDVGIDRIVNCGLIINELVTNAFKYAFPGGKSGVISIGLRRSAESEYELTVADNGIGIPKGFDMGAANTLGLELVWLLANQMGSVQFNGENGTAVKISIKDEKQIYSYS